MGTQPLPKKGVEPPNFRPMSVVSKRPDGSRWHLAWSGPWSRPHCIRRSPCFRERGTAVPVFGPCLLWPRSPISATAELLFYLLRLRRYKAKCVKTRCLQEGVSLSQDFRRRGHLPTNILIPLESQLFDCATTLPLTVFT